MAKEHETRREDRGNSLTTAPQRFEAACNPLKREDFDELLERIKENAKQEAITVGTVRLGNATGEDPWELAIDEGETGQWEWNKTLLGPSNPPTLVINDN